MRKLICILILALLLCASALADGAMEFKDDIYCIVPEAKGDALVRFEGGEKPLLSERADGIRDITMFGGDMYYLRDNGRFWELICRDKKGSVRIAHAFATGEVASGLSAYGENLFVLINGNLHMIYPGQGLCLKLAGAKMAEYVIHEDHAYYVSGETQEYSFDYDGGTVIRQAGGIYRVNLSTGDTAAVVQEGCYDLGIYDGKLYFHCLSEPYAAVNGERAILCGKICFYDIASGESGVFHTEYDWGYAVLDGGIAVRNAQGVHLNGECIAQPGEMCEIFAAGGKLAVYDPENIKIEIIR